MGLKMKSNWLVKFFCSILLVVTFGISGIVHAEEDETSKFDVEVALKGKSVDEFVVTIQNISKTDASNVTVQTTIPSTLVNGGQAVTWTVDKMAKSEVREFTFKLDKKTKKYKTTTKHGKVLPQTGENKGQKIVYSLLGIVLLGIAIYFLVIKKKLGKNFLIIMLLLPTLFVFKTKPVLADENEVYNFENKIIIDTQEHVFKTKISATFLEEVVKESSTEESSSKSSESSTEESSSESSENSTKESSSESSESSTEESSDGSIDKVVDNDNPIEGIVENERYRVSKTWNQIVENQEVIFEDYILEYFDKVLITVAEIEGEKANLIIQTPDMEMIFEKLKEETDQKNFETIEEADIFVNTRLKEQLSKVDNNIKTSIEVKIDNKSNKNLIIPDEKFLDAVLNNMEQLWLGYWWEIMEVTYNE